jgi:hypothetical protein
MEDDVFMPPMSNHEEKQICENFTFTTNAAMQCS